MSIVAADIPPNDEDHVCVTLALPNEHEVWVKAIHLSLTPGSHHLIVDRLPLGSGTSESVSSCPPTNGGDGTRLAIAQQAETTISLPEGVAFRIEPHQPIFLQLHYYNYLDAIADIEGTVELELVDPDTTPIEARSLFTGSLSLHLPPNQETLVESFMRPAESAQQPKQVFALTSHTHQLGVRATIERVTDSNAADATPIHESLQWSEPPLTLFDPPLTFDGTDGLRLRCQYVNTTDRTVTFGVNFDDEMCFMWLYYFEAH